MLASSSALSLPLLFDKERGFLHTLALLLAVVVATGYFMLVWLVVWGGEHCCSQQTLTSARNYVLLSNLQVQVWAQNVFLAIPFHPGNRGGLLLLFPSVSCICFHNSALQSTRFIVLPLGVLGEREKDPQGALCCSHGGCWCLPPAFTDWEGAFSGFLPHAFLSFCEHQFCQGNKPMYI